MLSRGFSGWNWTPARRLLRRYYRFVTVPMAGRARRPWRSAARTAALSGRSGRSSRPVLPRSCAGFFGADPLQPLGVRDGSVVPDYFFFLLDFLAFFRFTAISSLAVSGALGEPNLLLPA